MITVYSLPSCPQCDATVQLLNNKNLEFVKIDMREDIDALDKIKDLGYKSAPVVVVNENNHWSGFRPDKIQSL